MITKRQSELLTFIMRYRNEYGNSPTFEEIRGAVGFNDNKTVLEVLSALERKGLVERKMRKARSIMISEKGWNYLYPSEKMQHTTFGNLSFKGGYSNDSTK